MTRILASTALALTLALPVVADEVTDALQSALNAYEEGDIQYAMEELAFAQQLMQGMKAGSLAGFLPEGLDGWTREIDDEAGQGMAMLGGTAAAANYSNGSESFTITVMADSPMIAGMAGMFSNPMLMAAAGGIVRVGREKFVDQDGEIVGLIGGRVLIQASGGPSDVMIDHLKEMDFRELSRFGS